MCDVPTPPVITRWVNCAVVYVQNAKPDGPAAYMMHDVVDRTLRWEEGPEVVLK